MRNLWNKMFGGECEHKHTLVVSSAGVRRTVCEKCGHVSFKMTQDTEATSAFEAQTEMPRASGL